MKYRKQITPTTHPGRKTTTIYVTLPANLAVAAVDATKWPAVDAMFNADELADQYVGRKTLDTATLDKLTRAGEWLPCCFCGCTDAPIDDEGGWPYCPQCKAV